MARAEAYLHAKFHLDPSNRLATIHQRHRQTDRTDRRTDSIGRTVLQTFAQKGSRIYIFISFRLVPKSVILIDLERRNGTDSNIVYTVVMVLILRYFTEFGSFRSALCKSR